MTIHTIYRLGVWLVLMGILVGQPGPFTGLAVMGAVVAIPLGYAYVALVVVLREICGPRSV